jgi:hypothetical protein
MMFEHWDSFYLLVGSAAGALVGLLFVVASLTVGIDPTRAERGNKYFLSPTVFHLATVFVVSAITMAPVMSPAITGALIGTTAFVAFVYAGRNALALTQPIVSQHWTDFWYYGAGPLVCYVALGVLSVQIWQGDAQAPYRLATLLVVLVLVCIRNAWDLVTWIATREKPAAK